MKKGFYIYCIIDTPEQKNFKPIGIHGAEMSIITFKDISAVVNEIPIHNFDRFAKEELTHYVAVHQKVNEEVMKYCNVVPMAFGMIAPDTNEILRIIKNAYLQFKIAFERTAGMVEFAIQVLWDQKKILQNVANTNPEIQRLKKEILLMRGVKETLSDPIEVKIGELLYHEMEARKRSFREDIRKFLLNIVQDFTENKLITDTMIANFSILIERVREFELDKKMNELGKIYEGKLQFKYIGPMPPSSFVHINLRIDNVELVNQAKELLGLKEYATFDEIKEMYHALAHQYHPDKHKYNSQIAQKKMKEISQAYQLLKSYCQSCDEVMGEAKNQRYSFKKADIKNAILVK